MNSCIIIMITAKLIRCNIHSHSAQGAYINTTQQKYTHGNWSWWPIHTMRGKETLWRSKKQSLKAELYTEYPSP